MPNPYVALTFLLFPTECRAAFELEFLVPVDAATDTLTVSTDSTDTELFREIADGMDVGVKKLRIAYHFNFWAKPDKPRLLNTSKHVKALFDAAHAEMEARDEAKSKNIKSKRKPALQVIISDLRPKQELVKVGKGKGKVNHLLGMYFAANLFAGKKGYPCV
jgi:hypothetical protein